MNNFFKEEFTLCYKQNHFTSRWKCEYGFSTINEVHYRTNAILKLCPNTVTTFIPINSGIPPVIQREIIRLKLTKIPSIDMIPKPIEENKYYSINDID